jgi:hypothetical protein
MQDRSDKRRGAAEAPPNVIRRCGDYLAWWGFEVCGVTALGVVGAGWEDGRPILWTLGVVVAGRVVLDRPITWTAAQYRKAKRDRAARAEQAEATPDSPDSGHDRDQGEQPGKRETA